MRNNLSTFERLALISLPVPSQQITMFFGMAHRFLTALSLGRHHYRTDADVLQGTPCNARGTMAWSTSLYRRLNRDIQRKRSGSGFSIAFVLIHTNYHNDRADRGFDMDDIRFAEHI